MLLFISKTCLRVEGVKLKNMEAYSCLVMLSFIESLIPKLMSVKAKKKKLKKKSIFLTLRPSTIKQILVGY